MLRLLTDEDLDGRIVTGLLAAEEPNLDLVRVQDVWLMQTPDERVLEWAAKEDRILLTQDGSTMPPTVRDRISRGLAVPGIIIRRRTTPIIDAIEELLLIAQCTEQQEWRDRGISYLPL